MYVLDTNVLSEIMKDAPDASLAAWLRAGRPDAMFTTSICKTEILYGVRRLPEGRRSYRLSAAAEAMFRESFAGRILSFDSAAASVYADIRIAREQSGVPVTREDGMIAAIARTAGAAIVTRDEQGFVGCGVPVINPWRTAR